MYKQRESYTAANNIQKNGDKTLLEFVILRKFCCNQGMNNRQSNEQ
ncbi:hypothetical protein [Blautia intestinalis]|nr:hypothetical protein [Blautia intestinalis]